MWGTFSSRLLECVPMIDRARGEECEWWTRLKLQPVQKWELIYMNKINERSKILKLQICDSRLIYQIENLNKFFKISRNSCLPHACTSYEILVLEADMELPPMYFQKTRVLIHILKEFIADHKLNVKKMIMKNKTFVKIYIQIQFCVIPVNHINYCWSLILKEIATLVFIIHTF